MHPSALLSNISTREFFRNTREVHREVRGAAECFSHFSSVFKNSQVLTDYRGQVQRFSFFLLPKHEVKSRHRGQKRVTATRLVFVISLENKKKETSVTSLFASTFVRSKDRLQSKQQIQRYSAFASHREELRCQWIIFSRIFHAAA